jgi:hypothetical protein
MLVITVLWAVTPAVACLLPTRPMTAAEHECCRKMAHQCGPFAVAVVPQTAIVLINPTSVAMHLAALEAPPPEASPGCSSILRI